MRTRQYAVDPLYAKKGKNATLKTQNMLMSLSDSDVWAQMNFNTDLHTHNKSLHVFFPPSL